MESFDYPDNDPGPQTLMTSIASDRLHWPISRFPGYVGIVNYMGARFTSPEQALAPILREAAERTVRRRAAWRRRSPAPTPAVCQGRGHPRFGADRIAHRRRAGAARSRARECGSVVGIASAAPATIGRIALWARVAESRGFVLVPISAVANRPKSS